MIHSKEEVLGFSQFQFCDDPNVWGKVGDDFKEWGKNGKEFFCSFDCFRRAKGESPTFIDILLKEVLPNFEGYFVCNLCHEVIPFFKNEQDLPVSKQGKEKKKVKKQEKKPKVNGSPLMKEAMLKAQNPCPAGKKFGIDIDSLKSCASCDLWDDCAEEEKKLKSNAGKLKTRKTH